MWDKVRLTMKKKCYELNPTYKYYRNTPVMIKLRLSLQICNFGYVASVINFHNFIPWELF
jgi:hypothetical protein